MAFAAKDSTFKFQNSVRIGYDDNVYQTRDVIKQDSAFITDIFNVTGDLNFSDRTDMSLYWQPELRYRFDADPELITYQDLYASLGHAVSERLMLELSDHLRYQDKEGQSDLAGGNNIDQNFLENTLLGALDYSLDSVSRVKVGAGYEFRTWDDDFYGETRGNNYDQLKADGSYIRALTRDKTFGLVGVNYVNHEYDGSRGGFDSTTLYGGVDHNFNPSMLGTAQLGYTFGSVDSFSGSEDTSSPYLQAGLDYKSTDRTSFNGTLGYTISQSENSYFNAADTFNLGLGVKHDLTGKINLSSTLRYTMAKYDSSYARFGIPDSEEDFVRFSIRGSYQINRNNFVDVGYEFSMRDSDFVLLQEYDRNRTDIGWRVRF
jgi:hypothetical protein